MRKQAMVAAALFAIAIGASPTEPGRESLAASPTVYAGMRDDFPAKGPRLPSAIESTPASASRQTPGEIGFGLYNPGVPDDINQVAATENAIGKRAAILMFYKHWGGPWNNFYARWIDAISAHGAVAMITWMSDDYTIAGYPNPGVERAYSNQQIISGRYDGFIRGWADGLKATGRLVLLRFDHEMNGNWYAWSPGLNGNSAAGYVAMWRHVHDIFVQEGAVNVRWVWSPNVDYPGAPAFEAMYPGDPYVDWIALDGYNWGLTNGYTPWRSFTAVFGSSYGRLSRLTAKPVMIAEVGSVEAGAAAGQTKAGWIASALERELPANFPRVRAFIWFDQNNGGGQDFRIASSAGSLATFRQAMAQPLYQSSLQGN